MAQSIESKTQPWTKWLRQFENFSLTFAEFCQSIGCSIPTFYHWRNKLQASKPALPKPAFLQVQSEPRTAQIQIKLTSGVVITLPVEAIDSLPRILDQVA
ncbi:MAG: IS66 family insertion sequence element accessory protein TnpA [Pirellula sp.]